MTHPSSSRSSVQCRRAAALDVASPAAAGPGARMATAVDPGGLGIQPAGTRAFAVGYDQGPILDRPVPPGRGSLGRLVLS